MLKKKLLATICACSTLILAASPLFADTQSGAIKDLPQEKQQAILTQLTNNSDYASDCVINGTAKVSTKISKLPANLTNNEDILTVGNMNMTMNSVGKYDKDTDIIDDALSLNVNLPKNIGNLSLSLDALMQNLKTPQKLIYYFNIKDLKLPKVITQNADAATLTSSLGLIKGSFLKLDINALMKSDPKLKTQLQPYLSNPDMMNSIQAQILTALKPYIAAGTYTIDGNKTTLTFDVKNPKNIMSDLLKSIDTSKLLGDLNTKLPAQTGTNKNVSASDIKSALDSQDLKVKSVKYVVELTDNKVTASNIDMLYSINMPGSQQVKSYKNVKTPVIQNKKVVTGYKTVKTKKGTTKQPIYKNKKVTTYVNKNTLVKSTKTVNVPVDFTLSANSTIKYQDVALTAPTTSIDLTQLLNTLGK